MPMIKQFLYISNPIDFVKGKYDWCFNLSGRDLDDSDWINVGEIEIDVNIDMTECINLSIEAIDEKEKETREEFNTKIALLNQQRQELLCLTNGVESENSE